MTRWGWDWQIQDSVRRRARSRGRCGKTGGRKSWRTQLQVTAQNYQPGNESDKKIRLKNSRFNSLLHDDLRDYFEEYVRRTRWWFSTPRTPRWTPWTRENIQKMTARHLPLKNCHKLREQRSEFLPSCPALLDNLTDHRGLRDREQFLSLGRGSPPAHWYCNFGRVSP